MASQYDIQSYQPLTNRQKKLLDNLLSGTSVKDMDVSRSPLYKGGLGYLQNLLSGDPEAFEDFEAPYMQQYQQEILPQIAERFAGMGAQSSSAFNQSLSRSAQDLSTQLASLRSGLQMQSLPLALQYSMAPGESAYRRAALGLGTKGREFMGVPQQPSFGSSLGGSLAKGLGYGIGSMFGGPVGGGLGGMLGGLFGGGGGGGSSKYEQIFF